MSIARRRFFKMAAAPAVAGVTPALAAPMVEMVEADIRARMVEIARQIDADMEEALRSHLQETIDG